MQPSGQCVILLLRIGIEKQRRREPEVMCLATGAAFQNISLLAGLEADFLPSRIAASLKRCAWKVKITDVKKLHALMRGAKRHSAATK
jgi:hypothetical protein